ncbi:sulfite exporter TauE/SafE family protein [Aliikangiella coralliicola]|uniref:Probable membrane transporter protein n=1 Tax=Aliikangiella coralliicola TaxID=2592383 RepID=A0A545UCL5_9GAMM|nr:sulfite exporter TauE/SafE family protein [Aliikangiella coralliicola]TQV87211.1 sulfite exporter TauE/SafE family protein [Aliikangiella coralliicola]
MTLFIIALVSCIASLLTFFSGFGLGTLLTPVFALFFPVQLAIAATAIVHLANNFFKLGLIYKHIRWDLFLKFSIPAGIAALLGASTLSYLGELPKLYAYSMFSSQYEITPIKLLVGVIFIIFAFSELSKKLQSFKFKKKYISLGGLLSGFFGGLTGNQGAFRSAFLIKFSLPKKEFIATGVISSCLVDIARISIYFNTFEALHFSSNLSITILTATLCAFIGAIIGRFYLNKITMKGIQLCVSLLMIFVGVGLSVGLI